MKNEYKTTLLAVMSSVKPCCILIWLIAFIGVGAGAGALSQFAPKIDFALVFLIGLPCILYSLWKVSRALVWCSRNKAIANWGLASLNASIVLLATILYGFTFAHNFSPHSPMRMNMPMTMTSSDH